MSKVIQVVVYKSVSDPEKLAAYAVLARPAMEKAGAKFIARGVPFAVKEDGEAVRTIVVEWESMEAAENGYNSPDYQNAIKALDNGAKHGELATHFSIEIYGNVSQAVIDKINSLEIPLKHFSTTSVGFVRSERFS